jgi:hypothetical protein
MTVHPDFALLEQSHGIIIPDVQGYVMDGIAKNYQMAADAQPSLVTVSNNGIPAFLSTWIDPKIITVMVSPNSAAKILGEEKKGDWVTRTAVFPMVESTGTTSSYGDYSKAGATSANAQFPARQSFHYQTITEWGQKQLAEAGLAQIDWAQRLNIASVMVLDKFQNNSYFYGIGGLQNYGLLNDPALPAAILPSTKVAGGRTWANATPNEIYADIQALFAQLVTQTSGLIEPTTKMVFATTPVVSIYLSNKNGFGLSVWDMMKDTFPNIRFESATQYATSAGNMAQLIAEEVDGQETGTVAFTEKMRAHAVVADVSSWKQKKSQGTWGAIIYLPMAFAQMIGL